MAKTIVVFVFLSVFILKMEAQDYPLDCYEMVWEDDFISDAVDLSKWNYQTGAWNGSNVQNCYKQENVSISNGSLEITAKNESVTCNGLNKNFSSGFVQTKNIINWTFGYFEAKVRVPQSNSTWPAFWMSPQDNVYGNWPRSGEIDIFEIRGHDMTASYGNAHWGNSGDDKKQQKGSFLVEDAHNWHVYGVEWKLGELKFYIDGVHYHTIDNFKEPNAGIHPQPFDQGFYLRLNMAVGGDYLDSPWNDAHNGIDQLPAKMEVDWVKVYQVDPNCTPEMDCEIIENGSFDKALDYWTLHSFNTATGSVDRDKNGYAHIDVVSTGTANWHLALRQTGILLENEKNYNVSFVAYADSPRSANLILSRSDGSQYHYQGLQLKEHAKAFTFQFVMDQPDDSDSHLSFGVGSSAINVYIDNVSIEEVDCLFTRTNDDTFPSSSIKLFPNPISNQVYISFPDSFKEYHLKIFDVTGTIYHSQKLNNIDNIEKIDLSFLNSGMYIMTLTGSNGYIESVKFTKH